MNKILKSVVLTLAFGLLFSKTFSQEEEQKTMEIYGFIMADAGYNFGQVDPKWYDVMRPTKLPSFKNEFGTDGNFFLSARQTRFGVKNFFDTPLGQVKTHFEIDMFGVGADAGQTTIRLRHAYGELGKFGAGQTHSPFMDIDVFPNTLEYWGPNGMLFFRNIQVRYMPIQGDTRLTIALENPGGSNDAGIYADRIELEGVSPRFPLPDLSAEYRQALAFGYVEVAGMLRSLKWEDQNDDQIDLSGGDTGWGLSLSTNLHLSEKDVFRGQFVYGEGIQNYFNDAPTDVAIQNNFSNASQPVVGVALPVMSAVAFLDHSWSEKFSSSIGYSFVDIDNTDGQAPNAYRKGQYMSVNLIYYPTKNVMAGMELEYMDRANHSDGFTSSATILHFSFKYNFSQSFYKN